MAELSTTYLLSMFRSFARQAISWKRQAGPKILDTIKMNGYLGFTCFGGPPVHFQIFHRRFVEKYQWLDEPMFQELFAVVQALSGPGSTKMLYCINLQHNGSKSAVAAFLIWSLPGAIGMYGLSIGISSINNVLPASVYALLSGLNAATVGVIALAAVQLSHKTITDKTSRLIIFLGASAGMLYNALWFFPLLLLLAAAFTIVWDLRWFHKAIDRILKAVRRPGQVASGGNDEATATEQARASEEDVAQTGSSSSVQEMVTPTPASAQDTLDSRDEEGEARVIPRQRQFQVPWVFGIVIILAFFLTFAVIMVLRGTLKYRPILFSLFSNMYLAGTIIFGGGPVVIPLLREYVVAEGWVSSRDFLLGLAIIQAFPGPNFNFAVYLGSLTAINAKYSGVAGALLGYLGIFAPGLILVHGTMGIWKVIRTHRMIKSALRGINAAAVGFIYTAVYRLWEIGYIDQTFTGGSSLGRDPWWVVVTATSYVGVCWFSLPVPLAIVLGAVMGLIRYGVTTA